MRFQNQNAIVTGAGRGIGHAIAVRLASEGASVACVSRTEANAKRTADEINLLRAGAAGYINKESASNQLVGAIRTVVRGRKFVSPALAQILADGVSGDADRPLHEELSQREFQIFCKLAGGAAVSKIADELHLSVKTVSTYRTRVLEKMGMKSNADLTYYAIKNGLID